MQDKKKKEQSNEPKKDTAEDRAKKELEKIASYQARLAKKKNKPKKIKTVMDDSNRRDFSKKGIISYYFVTSKGTVNSNTSHIFSGSLKRSKSSFAADLTDTSKKGVNKMRYE